MGQYGGLYSDILRRKKTVISSDLMLGDVDIAHNGLSEGESQIVAILEVIIDRFLVSTVDHSIHKVKIKSKACSFFGFNLLIGSAIISRVSEGTILAFRYNYLQKFKGFRGILSLQFKFKILRRAEIIF